jgi:hypothetical protein
VGTTVAVVAAAAAAAVVGFVLLLFIKFSIKTVLNRRDSFT